MSCQKKCPGCGSLDILEDSHYCLKQLVCADCGFILTEGDFKTTLADETHWNAVAYPTPNEQKWQQSRALQRGIKRVQDLCRILRLPFLFEETAVSYYQQAIKCPCFALVSLERKEIIVGCCVFVTCRQHSWPLTMGTICLLLYADKDQFSRTYFHFLKELALDVPALSLIDLVKTQLSSFKLCQESPNIPAKFAEDKAQLEARTVQMMELASETWLVTGRLPAPIVTAATFLAWQSLRPWDRLKCTLAQFCKMAGVDLRETARKRLKELQHILLQMASQLSWLRGLKVSRKDVVKHAGDLLQHRRLLLRAAFRAVDGTEGDGAGTPEATGQLMGEDGAVSERTPGPEEQNCGSKRTPLLPPCLLNPAKKLRTPDPRPEDLDITGDEPILDSEIEQYIRTPEEQQRLQLTHDATLESEVSQG